MSLSGNYAVIGSQFVKELFIFRFSNRDWEYQNRIDIGAEFLALDGSDLIVCNQFFETKAYSLTLGNGGTDDDDDIAEHHESNDVTTIVLAAGLGGGSLLLVVIATSVYCFCYSNKKYKAVVLPVDEEMCDVPVTLAESRGFTGEGMELVQMA